MKKTLRMILALSVILVSTGCLTKPETVITSSSVPITIKSGEGSISLTYMTEDELIDQFGRNGNVFATFPAKLQPRRNIVFKLDIESINQTVTLDLRNIIFKMGEVSSLSKYSAQLINSWSTYLQTEKEQVNANRLTVNYMHKNKITINPGESVSGLIVFLDKFPKYGESFIRYGIKDQEGKLHEFQMVLDPLFMKETESQ